MKPVDRSPQPPAAVQVAPCEPDADGSAGPSEPRRRSIAPSEARRASAGSALAPRDPRRFSALIGSEAGGTLVANDSEDDAVFVRSLPPSALRCLHVLLSEGAAKGSASFLHFGLVQAYSAVMAERVLDHLGIEGTANRRAAAAALQAPVMATAHYIGEVLLRPFLLSLFGASLEPVKPGAFVTRSLAEADALRTRRAKLEKATKPGEPVGDILALSSFMMVHVVRKLTLGNAANRPLVVAGFSGLSGALGVGAQTAVALSARVDAGGTRSPAFKVMPRRPQDAFTALSLGLKASSTVTNDHGDRVVGHGPVGNVVQDLFIRTFALFVGLMLKATLTSIKPDDTPGHRAFNGAMGSFSLLGLAYFAQLGLLTMRGKVNRPFDSTRRGLRALDPRLATGSTAALVGPGAGAVSARACALLDGTHGSLKAVVALPGHLAFEVHDALLTAGCGAIRSAQALVRRGLDLAARRARGPAPEPAHGLPEYSSTIELNPMPARASGGERPDSRQVRWFDGDSDDGGDADSTVGRAF